VLTNPPAGRQARR